MVAMVIVVDLSFAIVVANGIYKELLVGVLEHAVQLVLTLSLQRQVRLTSMRGSDETLYEDCTDLCSYYPILSF